LSGGGKKEEEEKKKKKKKKKKRKTKERERRERKIQPPELPEIFTALLNSLDFSMEFRISSEFATVAG